MRQGGREGEKERERILYIKDPAKRDKLIERIMSTSLSIFKKEKKMKREKEREGKKEGEGKEKKSWTPKEYIPYGCIKCNSNR